MQALQEKVAELERRLKEVSEENRDLRDFCEKNSIQYEEFLAARRHSSVVACAAAAARGHRRRRLRVVATTTA